MEFFQKVLMVDCRTSFSKLFRFKVGDFFGPVDLGLHLSARYNSLNIGTGLLAGSIFPGSNRLIFTGFSPCWGGFYISSMGGAGLVFEHLGITVLDEWYVIGEFHGSEEHSTLGRLGDIRGRPDEQDLARVRRDAVRLAQALGETA